MQHNQIDNINIPIKMVARLASIKNIKKDVNSQNKVTNPATDFFGDELLVTINNIKQHQKEESKKNKPKKKTKLIKTHLHSMPYKEVPENYKIWWRKEDIKKLYKGLMVYGYDLSYLEYYLEYKWTRKQIDLRLKHEYRVRPHLIEKAMLLKK